MKLTIGHLYPDLLNLYGDRGNIQCFRKRLEWRGMEAEVIPFLSGDSIDFSKLDIVLLGGGSDREQEIVCNYLKDIQTDFQSFVEKDGVVLAVCGGYQLLGKYYKTDKKTIEGLSILDITTEWQPERLIRNIVLNSPLFDTPVVGFENHGGRTGSIWDIPMYSTTAPQISATISRRLLMVWVSATLISSGSARLPEKPVFLTISTSICSLTEGSHRTVALLVARLTLT